VASSCWLLGGLLCAFPRLISRNSVARNSPRKMPANVPNVVRRVASVVAVVLVRVVVAVTGSGVSVEVVKLVSVNAE
jgi:hypothetical protein